MTRTERLLELMQRLRRSRQPLQAHTLAEQLDISVRTLYRDIETLRRQGADIEGEAGVGYVLKKGGPTLPPLMFRESEIEALVLGLRWVGRHADPALADDARSALSKIGAILPPRLASIFDEHALYPAGRRQNTESDENSVLPCARTSACVWTTPTARATPASASSGPWHWATSTRLRCWPPGASCARTSATFAPTACSGRSPSAPARYPAYGCWPNGSATPALI